MTITERYQEYIDDAHQHAPFRLQEIIDIKHCPWPPPSLMCRVCGNHRLRYLCKCTDKQGLTWYIGRSCHTKLEERYTEEKLR